ncbi:serine/threonine-protein kinase [uncultured Roseibium sp.]|uniref:serine/threonine-protein kinase n=1 Tax=uncultured Roseibium sp. TaxID=1936171 RepID=UPI0032170CD4
MSQKIKKTISIETTFDEYVLEEIIGEGGSGRVYGGVSSSGNSVAVKILSSDKVTTEKRRRFKNEIRFLADNKHPNIVNFIDHGVALSDSLSGPFYVMRRYGSNLRQFMNAGVEFEALLSLFHGILDGVEAAHLKGVIHRDIKPENILVDENTGTPAIADFGISSFTDDIVSTLVDTDPKQKLANFVYAAPEQRAQGREVRLTADIYALGLILNELFTGDVPFGTEYRSITDVHPDYKFLDEVVGRMIRQDPGKRYASIGELKKAISLYRNEFFSLQKLSRLSQTVIPEGEVDEPLAYDPPVIEDVDWNDGVLRITLDRHVTADWIDALLNMPNYSCISGYSPGVFFIRGKVATANVPSHAVKDVVRHFKDWLPNASRILKSRLQRELNLRQEQERVLLLKKKEAEEVRLSVLRDLEI